MFAKSQHWKSYDIFNRQKLSTFKSSRPAVLELAARYKDIITQLSDSNSSQDKPPQDTAKAEEVLFTEMCEICLWGNATDLSLLTNLSYEDIQKLQGSAARKSAENNILVNDLPAAFSALKQAQREKPKGYRCVDIVLDNAGFELFVDLILAGYLLAAGLASNIVLHPKVIPWFVSDVIPNDFGQLINALANPQAFYNSLAEEDNVSKDNQRENPPLSPEELANLSFLFKHWTELYGDGKLVIRPNRFWTMAGSYWRIPSVVPDLYSDLKSSELVIFKGDLNYRKLTGDVMWSPTTAFSEAIGPLARDGIKVLALRTCKADVVVGLQDGEDEKLKAAQDGGDSSGARKWAWSGKWALVQFWDGKSA